MDGVKIGKDAPPAGPTLSAEEIADVRKSFTDMGIDVNELFKALDEMEAAGLDSTLGPDGKEFFKTLRKILTTA